MSHWLFWFALAIGLAAAEMGAASSFYLVLMAVAAGIVGVLAWAVPELPAAAEWTLFAVGSALLLAGCRKTLCERVDGGMARGEEPHWMVGRTLTANEPVGPGRTARVQAEGSGWSVRNTGGEPIAAGDRMRVDRIDGVTLRVSRARPPDEHDGDGPTGSPHGPASEPAGKREGTGCST